MPEVIDSLAAALVAGAQPADRDALEDVLAVFVMSVPPAQRDTDDEVIALLGRFAQRVGLKGSEAPVAAQQAIAVYLDAHPLKTELLNAAARVAREHLGTPGALGNSLARFAQDDAGKGVLGGSGERPAGSTPAGPLARFLVQKK